MPERGAVGRLLDRAVEGEFENATVPAVSYFETRRRRRRQRRWAVVTAVCATGVVAAGIAVVAHRGGGRPEASQLTVSPSVTPPGVTAPELAGYSWQRIPEAPVDGRGEAAFAWTGTELVVWGGSPDYGDTVYGDGAAYDPASRTWTTLPGAPLTPRSSPAYAYAGGSLFIWGGWLAGGVHAHDGALYEPATQTWSRLPDAPVGDYEWAQAFAIGHEIVLLSTASNNATEVHADAFDLDTGAWADLPDLQLPDGHSATFLTAVVGDERVFVWSHWSRTEQIDESSFRGYWGIDGFTFDAATNEWSANDFVPSRDFAISDPVWTGSELVLPASQGYCGATCRGPFVVNDHGYRIDPGTGATTPLPPGPIDRLLPHHLWTGSALLAYESAVYTSSSREVHYPGEAAVWDPRTDQWTQLPSAPLTSASDDPVAVWAGDRLIEWGRLYPADEANSGGTHSTEAVGIEFAPHS